MAIRPRDKNERTTDDLLAGGQSHLQASMRSGVTTGPSEAIGSADLGRRAGSSLPRPPSRRGRNKGSEVEINYGKASVKAYPIFQWELWGLGGMGLGATLSFSLASGLLAFYFDTAKDLDLSQGVAPDITAYWEAMRDSAFYGSLGLYFIGALFIAAGTFGVIKIIKRAVFTSGG